MYRAETKAVVLVNVFDVAKLRDTKDARWGKCGQPTVSY
jgi:hypothetical protein